MEGTNLINKAGMFDSDDAWSLIPLNSKIVNVTSKFDYRSALAKNLRQFVNDFYVMKKLPFGIFQFDKIYV